MFKGVGSTEDVKANLHAFRKEVENAKAIVIAGGGPTGIEFAGEVAHRYGSKKQVYLVS